MSAKLADASVQEHAFPPVVHQNHPDGPDGRLPYRQGRFVSHFSCEIQRAVYHTAGRTAALMDRRALLRLSRPHALRRLDLPGCGLLYVGPMVRPLVRGDAPPSEGRQGAEAGHSEMKYAAIDADTPRS